ncbi:ATP-binding protein [Flavitalea flava]
MKRTELQALQEWKTRPKRKPLIIRGARQVGKTWLMKTFGAESYPQTAYFNFEGNQRLRAIFSGDFIIDRIIRSLSIEAGFNIQAENTLLIFDEIQEAPEALTSLKYFYENAPQYHILAAGSLLGVALHEHSSFPVGKVEFLDLHPLSFPEFLMAIGQKPLGEEPLVSLLKSMDWDIIKSFKTKYIELLKQYYYVGGMPEAVVDFAAGADFKEVRNIQKRILAAYEQDFSKHAPNEIVPRIRMLWNSIPAQLAKENRKFIYSHIKQGARAKDYELALSWLIDCGLVHKVNRATKPAIPLKAYEDFSAFKLYISDIGLLAAMGDIDSKTLLEGNSIFQEFKGALTEQYVLQQLITHPDWVTYYWSADNGSAEIDFLLQLQGQIIPVEVKAEESLMAKSLKVFFQQFKPATCIRTSMSDFRKEDWLTNLPLYAIHELPGLINPSL